MTLTEEVINTLKKLEESLWISETRCDKKYMETILSPAFFEFGRSGRIYKREEIIDIPFQEINAKLPLKDFQIRFINVDVVLITYISEVQYDELEIGNRSSLWSKNSGKWQLQFHQGTPAYQ